MLYFFVRLLMILSSLIVAYRGIGIPLLCSYLGGSKSQNAFCKQACVGFFDFLAWAGCQQDCSVLRTPTILPDSRISWDLHPTFMLLSGRVKKSKRLLQASLRRLFDFLAWAGCQQDCSVLRTPTILPDSRISWDLHPTFMLLSGRVKKSKRLLQASLRRLFDFLTLASYMIQDFFVFTNAKWCKRKKKSKYVQIVNKTL